MKREFSTIRGQFPQENMLPCKTCLHRDRTEVKIGDKIIKAGITKSHCNIFLGPPIDKGKPSGILFYGDDCDFYEEDA